MGKIILLNGPPRSGKDAVARILARDYGYATAKFAGALKRYAHDLFGLRVSEDFFETTKSLPAPEFLNKTPREIYIAVSEQLFKPLFGQDFFGQRLAETIERFDHLSMGGVAVSDSGFVEEARVLVRRFGAARIELVRINRPGFNFGGDSRSYINLDSEGVRRHELNNFGNLSVLEAEVRTLMEEIGS